MVEEREARFKHADVTIVDMINELGLGKYICIYCHGKSVGTFENTEKGFSDVIDIISIQYQNTDVYVYFPPEETEE